MLRAQKGVNHFRSGIGGLNQGLLFFSNQLEKLLLHLKKNLFLPGSTPFSERILLLPSVEMKRWIFLQLAEEMGVAAGISCYSLEEALSAFCTTKSPPSPLPFTLQIFDALHLHLEEPPFAPVRAYLKGKDTRAIQLCYRLSYLFARYSIYGVENWNHPWQKILWQEVGFTWDVKRTERVVHLFGFSHIPPPFFPLFPSFFYFLSPTQEFWSEGDAHPLLSDLGYVGTRVAKYVEENDLCVVEDYEDKGLTPTQSALLHLEPGGADETIEFHVASSMRREVEICYHNILATFPACSPRDILVMSPKISDYEPLIRAVFGSLCHITDLPTLRVDEELEGFSLLLQLEERRWSAEAILTFLRHPLVQRKRGIAAEDLLLFTKWLQKTGVRFGVNKEHRKEMVGVEEEVATFSQGIDQLLQDLALGEGLVEMTDADKIALLGETVEALYAKLRPLYSDKKDTMRGWISYLKELYEEFFVTLEGTFFAAWEKLDTARESLYSAEVVLYLLQKLLRAEEASFGSHEINAVRFCSLLPMRAVPAKIIYLLGMNQERFPRREASLSLDEAKTAPSAEDLDRYLFLETLLSYRQKLLISYVDTGEDPPSPVLQKIPGKIIKHPVTSYDPRYFSDPTLYNFSQSDYLLAEALSTPFAKKLLFGPPPSSFTPPVGVHEIPLTHLQKAITSPLAHYFSPLKFYEEPLLKEEEEFTLSPQAKARFHRLLLQMSHRDAQEKMRREGLWPLPKFFERVEAPSLMLRSKKIEICLPLSPESKVLLYGEIEGLGDEGLVRFDRISFAHAVKVFLPFLLANLEGPCNLLWEGKCFSPFFSSPLPYLEELVRYFFLAKAHPSPLFPSWIEPICEGEKELLPLRDGALQWALMTKELGDIFSWKEVAERLFGEMKHGWF